MPDNCFICPYAPPTKKCLGCECFEHAEGRADADDKPKKKAGEIETE